MKRTELSAQDQALLNTDFGDMDKEAAAQVELINDLYSTGFNKLATETADELDALDAAEKTAAAEEDEGALDEESEKIASDLAAYAERGYFDGLRKLGSERHGDELHYLYPMMAEKLASVAMEKAAAKSNAMMSALKNFGKSVSKNVRGGVKATQQHAGDVGKAGKKLVGTPGGKTLAGLGLATAGGAGILGGRASKN